MFSSNFEVPEQRVREEIATLQRQIESKQITLKYWQGILKNRVAKQTKGNK